MTFQEAGPGETLVMTVSQPGGVDPLCLDEAEPEVAEVVVVGGDGQFEV